jgi:ABC-type bacteriocin/lantibiotic exporter with double-glycine peptidase domain
MYPEFVKNVYQENKKLIWSNALLTLTIYPTEIILLGWISGMIFTNTNQKNLQNFWFYTCFFFIVFIMILIFKFIREIIDSKIIPSINTNVRVELYDRTTNKKVGLQTIDNGEFITRLQKIPYYIYMGYINSLSFLLPFLLTILGFIGFLFYIDWKIGLFSFFYLTTYCILAIYSYVKMSQLSFNRYSYEVVQGNEFEDILRNRENISLHNTFKPEKERLFSKEEELKKCFAKELQFISLFKLVCVSLLGLYGFLIILFGSYLVTSNKIPMFKLVILVVSSILMIRTFDGVIRKFTDTVMEFGPLWNDKKFINKVSSEQIHFGTKKDIFNNYTLSLENVSYKVGDTTILNAINLTVPYKQSVLITGNVGSGKSTLLKMLCGYYYPTQGSIKYDNHDMKQIDIEYLHQHVTMMHQRIELFKRSVVENIFYGTTVPPKEQLDRLKKLSIYSTLSQFINQKDATVLSGGQKQIVILLRCFYKTPKILILDEPTANLDPNIKLTIIQILNMLKNKCTMICVSHDSQIFSIFEKRYIMKHGVLTLR